MRICQVMIGVGFGGAERSFVDTALAMADRGHAVQAVCHEDFVKRELLEAHPAIRVSPVRIRGAWDIFGSRGMARVIGEFGPDVMHVHLARAAHLAGPIGRRMGVPVVAKLHNYANLKYYRSVDGFIGTTADQRRYLEKNGIGGDRVTVIPNFSRMPVIAQLRPQPVARSVRPLTFITCGRLHEVKGYDILLKAVRLLHDDGHRVQLVIGGDGPEKESLQKLTAELALTEDVEFAGWVDETQHFLDRGDIYVLSSRSESFGISLIEAMARGLPIVSTRCQGPRQILTDEQAWFADCENVGSLAGAMRDSITQVDLRARRAAEMRDYFRQTYAEALIAPRIVDFYRACGARDSGGAALDASWPNDFVEATSLAEAENERALMRVRRTMAAAIRGRGWTSCKAVMQARDVEVLRTTNGRDNCRVEISGAGSEPPRTAFLKRHREKAGTRIFRPEFRPAGWNEAEAVGLCERAGVATMRVLAAGREEFPGGGKGPSVFHSFSLTEAVGERSGFEVCREWVDEGRVDEADVVGKRQAMIEAAARLIRRLHHAGLAHQDLFWQHLFFETGADGEVSARIIDVQRLIRPANALAWAYFWIKDMEQVRFSMQRMEFPAADIQSWYEQYFVSDRLSAWQKLLTGVIRLRGLRRALRMSNKRRNSAVVSIPMTRPATAVDASEAPEEVRRAA